MAIANHMVTSPDGITVSPPAIVTCSRLRSFVTFDSRKKPCPVFHPLKIKQHAIRGGEFQFEYPHLNVAQPRTDSSMVGFVSMSPDVRCWMGRTFLRKLP